MSPRTCAACGRLNSRTEQRCTGCGVELGPGPGALALTASYGAGEVVQPPPTDTPDPYIGRQIGHYKIERRLGSGGMATVYRAVDLKLGRQVALKLLPDDRAGNEGARERFVREARAASALDHPNIGTVHDLDEVDGLSFITMTLYEGETLSARIRRGALPADEARSITLALLAGLDAAHKAGLAHRDVKPGNVMLTSDGQVKLLDFGLAKAVVSGAEESLTRDGTVVGTTPYMAPEQLRGERIDGRTDLWAVGVVLYQMLTAKLPFAAETAPLVMTRILSGKPDPVPPSVARDLAAVVDRLLLKPRERRFASAAEVIAALRASAPLPGAALGVTAPARSRRPLAIGLGFAVAASAVGAGVVIARNSGGPAALSVPAANSAPAPVAVGSPAPDLLAPVDLAPTQATVRVAPLPPTPAPPARRTTRTHTRARPTTQDPVPWPPPE
jgi:hypothetical protein